MNQNQEPQWLNRQLFPFQSRYLEIDRHRIHYIDEGNGATVLFLHGNPTWSFLYRKIIQHLRHDFRCLAVDYPGFGLSQAAPGYGFTPAEQAMVIESWLNALDLREIILFGQDWGGPVGLSIAGRQPNRFSGFVVGNTFAWPVNGNLRLELFSHLVGGELGDIFIRRFNAFVNWIIPVGMQRQHPTRQLMQHYRHPFPTPETREPTRIFAREILNSHEFLTTVAQNLPKIAHKPALIIWGDRDPAFRHSERQRFEQIFEHHTTILLKGAGHFIQEDAPEEIVTAFGLWQEGITHRGLI